MTAKTYVMIEALDNATPVFKRFDQQTNQAFEHLRRNAKASTANIGASFQKLKAHWVAYSVGAIAAVLAVQRVAKKLISTISGLINVSKLQEDAEKGLNAALETTGRFSKELSEHFKDLAGSIQQETRYGDEAIMGATALLAQLTKLDKEGLAAATKGAVGLASVFKTDLKSASTLVAKALAGNYGALSRYGIIVEKTATDEEKRASILNQLAVMYRRAQADTETFAGAQSQLTNTWGDMKEKLGDVIIKNRVLIEGIHSATDWIVEISQKIEDWREANRQLIEQKTDEYIGRIKAQIKNVPGYIKAITDKVKDLKAVYDALPKGVVGAAGTGLIGRILFGSSIGKIAAASYLISKNIDVIGKKIKDSLVFPVQSIWKDAQEAWLAIEQMFKGKPIEMEVHVKAPEGGFPTAKPELPLLEDITPKISAPEIDWKAYMDAKKSEFALLKEEQQSAHDFALLLAQDEVDKRIEQMEFMEGLEDQIHQDEMTRYEEVMAANEAYMKQYEANERKKAQLAQQAAITMLANWNDAFAQLAKGSETAFQFWKATAIAETIIDTYAAAQAAFKAMAGIPVVGPALGVAAAAAAIAAGMARVSAIKAQEPAAMYHTGGIVGRGSQPSRLVSSDVFAGAQRAHTGLGPDERPVIVKKDEGIFTKEQMAAMGAGDEESGRIDFHVHVIFNGREVTKDMAHTLETDGILLDRFRRALS